MLRKGLEREGIFIATAFDGLSGLEAARGRDFDVIVLDIVLPGLDGLQLTSELRASGVSTPILMLTARETSGDIVKGLSLGADAGFCDEDGFPRRPPARADKNGIYAAGDAAAADRRGAVP